MNDDTVTAPRWTAAQARELYNVAQWGEGYFDVAAGGHVLVRPFREKSDVAIDLYELAQRLPKEGLQLPVLVRFVHILHDRVDQLTGAFSDVIAELCHPGQYTAVYPIKTNTIGTRSVREKIVHAFKI